MKLVFVSNYFNHHQLSFCDALYELLDGSFCFLQTQPMEEERIRMGWPRDAPMCVTRRRTFPTRNLQLCPPQIGKSCYLRRMWSSSAGVTTRVIFRRGWRPENRSSDTMSDYIRKGNGKRSLPEDCCKSTRIIPDTVRHRYIFSVREPMSPAIII